MMGVRDADPPVLYFFRFRDPTSGKWVRARYKAERTEIATRTAEWEPWGPPEIRARAGAGPVLARNQLLLAAREAEAGEASRKFFCDA
jgi:hypothetical protein